MLSLTYKARCIKHQKIIRLAARSLQGALVGQGQHVAAVGADLTAFKSEKEADIAALQQQLATLQEGVRGLQSVAAQHVQAVSASGNGALQQVGSRKHNKSHQLIDTVLSMLCHWLYVIERHRLVPFSTNETQWPPRSSHGALFVHGLRLGVRCTVAWTALTRNIAVHSNRKCSEALVF